MRGQKKRKIKNGGTIQIGTNEVERMGERDKLKQVIVYFVVNRRPGANSRK